ncbi:MAG TPA: hypothetical protein VF509_07375 [Sphingobium sp.]
MSEDREDGQGPLGWIVRGKDPPRIARSLIARLEALDDLSSTISDVLDELGLVGAACASTLRPTLPGGRVIGTAITVRNQEQRASAFANVSARDWKMAELVAIAGAQPGDVLLIEGVPHVSNMGGIMATTAKRQGIAGAIVDGAVRDVGHSRSIEFPVWSRHVSPVTGKWRCITREINGPVTLAGLTVSAGDLVIADETGICFVPRDRVAQVVERCEQISAYEARLQDEIAQGLSADELIARLYGQAAANTPE